MGRMRIRDVWETKKLPLAMRLNDRSRSSGGRAKARGDDSRTPRRGIMRETVLALEIACHALIETLGQALAVFCFPEKLLVRRIAQKSDFG